MNCLTSALPVQPSAAPATQTVPAEAPPSAQPSPSRFGKTLGLLLAGAAARPSGTGAAPRTSPSPATPTDAQAEPVPPGQPGPTPAGQPIQDIADPAALPVPVSGPVPDLAAPPTGPAAPQAGPVPPLPAQPPAPAPQQPAPAGKPRHRSDDDRTSDDTPPAPATPAAAAVTPVVAVAAEPLPAPVGSPLLSVSADGPRRASRPAPPASPAIDAGSSATAATAQPDAASRSDTGPTPTNSEATPAPNLAPAQLEASRTPPPSGKPRTAATQQASATLDPTSQANADKTGLPPVQLPPTTQPAPAGTDKAGGSPAPPSPAAQLAPVMVSLAHASNGAQHLTVRLEPAELGQVEVRVDRSAGTPVRVNVTVQRPETLQLLLRDQPQLQRALDQAGLPADGRSLTFHIAPPTPTPATTLPSATFADSAGGGMSGGAHPGFTGQQSGHPTWMAEPDDETADMPAPALARWLRAGIDITA